MIKQREKNKRKIYIKYEYDACIFYSFREYPYTN